MILHFDGDLLVYRAGFAAEKAEYTLWASIQPEGKFSSKKDLDAYCEARGIVPVKQDENYFPVNAGEWSYTVERIVEPVENALFNCRSMVDRALEFLSANPSDLRMYLSGKTNYREGIATIKPYKGNRDAMHKPVHAPAIREYMIKKYNANVSVDEEADDVVAYTHYGMWLKDPYSSCIVSVDKDLKMVPGLHYNFVTEESVYIDEEEAHRYFLKQLITGDATDNIPGVPGKGKKAAEAVDSLASWDAWALVKTLYVQGYGDKWQEALLENGRLLWMRRKPNEWWNIPEELLCLG